MSGVWVLVEHRQGEISEITFEMLTKGRILAEALNCGLQAVVFASKVEPLIEKLKKCVPRIIAVEDEKLAHYNAPTYQAVLSNLLKRDVCNQKRSKILKLQNSQLLCQI